MGRIAQLWTPELELFWQPYLQSSRPIMIVLGAPLFTKFAKLKKSNAVDWEDLSAHNTIFLGSPKFIPQLKDIPFEQQFVIEGGSLRNLRPRPGEPEEYSDVWTPSHAVLLEDHALVTRLPGLHGHGEITILAASSTEGTWAAVEFVTKAQHAKDLVARLRLPSGKMPQSYQVVIRTKVKDQVPIEVSYVTHRVLSAPGAAPAAR